MIRYEDRSEYTANPTFRTQKYGNLLSDTYQGEVHQSGEGDWTGWVYNWSSNSKDLYRLGFKSKGAATRWVNKQLRIRGIDNG